MNEENKDQRANGSEKPTHTPPEGKTEGKAEIKAEDKAGAEAGAAAAETAGTPSPEARVAELEEQLKEEKNRYLYLYAEFDNFKKRSIKERSDLIKFGWESVARELVGVMENLERAVEHMPTDVDQNLKTGIEMVYNHFKGTMAKQGVAEVPAVGTNFNPEVHEAMGQEPSDKPQGTITQALTKGYTLHGRLLRAARVVVSTGTPAAGSTPATGNGAGSA